MARSNQKVVPEAKEALENAKINSEVWKDSIDDYLKLDVEGALNQLKYANKKGQEAFNSLLKNMDQDDANQLLRAFYQKWTIGQNEDLDNNILSKNNTIKAHDLALKYIQSLKEIYKNVNSQLSSQIQNNNLENFEGTAAEYQTALSFGRYS